MLAARPSRAQPPNSLVASCALGAGPSYQRGAERRRTTRPSARSSSTIDLKSVQTHRHHRGGAGVAARDRRARARFYELFGITTTSKRPSRCASNPALCPLGSRAQIAPAGRPSSSLATLTSTSLSLSPQAVLAAARPLQPPSHLPLCRRPRRRPRRHPRRRPRHRRLFRHLCRLRFRPSVTAPCRVCTAAVEKCV